MAKFAGSLFSKIALGAAFATSAHAPASAQETVKLPNNVTCIFEAIGPEMRENAQFLLVGLFATRQSPADRPDVKEELDAMIEHGHNQCLDLYPWASGESGNALTYATFRIFGGALTEALRESGYDPNIIDTYFEANIRKFGKARRLSEADKQELQAYLEQQGWDFEERGLADMAALRLEIAVILNQLNRGFRLNQYY